LLERSFGVLPSNLEPWIRPDKKYCDPFRPNVQPSGFITASDVLEDRQHHIDCVKKMFLDCDVFIFTLGLTEGWESLEGGITVPIAPGVVGGYSDIEKYRFKNYGHNECLADLSFFIDTLKILNPKVKIILTLSPVSLMATYENRHIICATTYSKSVLRVVAETVSSNRDYVDYFPSYEIITGNHNKGRFYADDLREVTLDGVDHVMKIFCNHYVNSNNLSPSASEVIISSEEMQEYEANIGKIICDEELLNVMRKTSSENGK
jgi:hypothetical protein